MSKDILGGWAIGHAIGNAARPTDALGAELARRERANAEIDQHNLEVKAKSLMNILHNTKSKLNAYVETEAELLAQLNEAGVTVPLGNEDAFLKRATEKYLEMHFDKKVINSTYPDGVLPNEQRWAAERFQEKFAAGTAKVKWHTDDYLENK